MILAATPSQTQAKPAKTPDCPKTLGTVLQGSQESPVLGRPKSRAARLRRIRVAWLQLCDSRSQLPMLGISVIKVSQRVVQNCAVLQQKILRP
jgi:hypothetical protein